MDYCEGGDLFKKINNQKGLLFPEEQVNTLLMCVLPSSPVHNTFYPEAPICSSFKAMIISSAAAYRSLTGVLNAPHPMTRMSQIYIHIFKVDIVTLVY